MKKVFVDTNIIVDLIADRKPHSKYAIELFTLAESKKVKLYTSSHSIVTAHYLLKKYVGEKELRKITNTVLEYLKPIAIDEAMLRRGLKAEYKDFEDGLQIIAASAIEGMDFIVTRNIRDFKGSEIMVLAPDKVKGKL